MRSRLASSGSLMAYSMVRLALVAKRAPGPHLLAWMVWFGQRTKMALSLVVDRKAREIAVVPGLAAVGGGGESDVAAAPTDAAGPAGDVERGHDGATPGEHIGLDFGLVITVGIGEIVDADSCQRSLCGSGERER